MKQVTYNAGDIIFKEGDPSDLVYKIVSGEVEVFMEADGKTVVLGLMKAGEFLGEMGIADDQPRSASARAKNQVSMIAYKEEEFFRLISRDSSAAEKLILRLCERLRNVSRKFTEAAVAGREEEVREEEEVSTGTRLTLLPLSPQLLSHLPEGGIQIVNLPYSVGRVPQGTDSESAMKIDLRLPDQRPYRLSRRHFALYENPDGYGILDLGSTLGTSLNEEYLGHNFGKDFGYLKMGENRVTAGGIDSPFTFKIIMESI